MKTFEFPPTGVTMIDRLVQRLRDTFASLQRAVTNDHIVTVTFTAGATDVQVRHGLTGPVDTWEVVDRDTDANLWRSPTVNPDPRTYILLQASAPTVARLRFT